MEQKKILFTSNCVVIFPNETTYWHFGEIFFFSFLDVCDCPNYFRSNV